MTSSDLRSPGAWSVVALAQGGETPTFYPDLQWRPISAGATGPNPTESGRMLGKRRTVAIKSQFSRLSPHGVTT
jgi:hypothetical protein